MSKMKYTITTYSCPHCHKIIKRENTAFAFLLIIVIYWVIADAIMQILYKDYYPVKVGESTESCPHCNNPISTGKIEYNRLNEDDKKIMISVGIIVFRFFLAVLLYNLYYFNSFVLMERHFLMNSLIFFLLYQQYYLG